MKNEPTMVEFVKALRDMADFYEARPAMPLPHTDTITHYPSKDPEVVAQFAHWLGTAKKDADDGEDGFFRMIKKFGPLQINVTWYRNEICERVVVGQEEVEEDVVVQKVTEKRLVVKDKIEWRCPTVLSNG